MVELSMDARVLVSSLFGFGEKSKLVIGGEGAKSVMSERCATAMNELINLGYVTASQFNQFGRMEYQGNDKLHELPRLSFDDVELHGQWSFIMPNPDLQERKLS